MTGTGKATIGIDHIPGCASRIVIKPDQICLLEAGQRFKDFFGLEGGSGELDILSGLSGIEKRTLCGRIYTKAKAREAFSYSRRAVRREKEPCWIEVQASYLEDVDGFPSFVAVVEDITDSVLTKMQLEETIRSLEKINKELEAIFGTIIDGVAKVADMDGYPVIFANDSFYKMIGYTKEQFVEECGGLLEHLDASGKEVSLEQSKEFRWQYRRRDGVCCWNRVDIAGTGEIYQGHPVIYVIFTDIDMIVRKEEELDRQGYFQSLIDSTSPSASLIRSCSDLKPLYITESAIKHFDYSKEEIYYYAQGRKHSIVHPEDCRESIRPVSEYTEGCDYNKEFRVKKKDGTYRWYFERTRLEPREGREPVYISTFMDITELKKSQEKARMREDQYRILVAHSEKMVYRYDIREKRVDIPKGAEYLSGLMTPVESIAQNVIDAGFVPEEYEEALRSFCDSVYRGEPEGRIKIKIRLGGSEYRWYEGRFSTVYDNDGNAASVIITVGDITSQQQKEAELIALRQSQRQTVSEENQKTFIRTFGYFDVFIDGKILEFPSRKGKELLAILVDRNGGILSTEEAVSLLWENEPMDKITAGRYRQTVLRLKNILDKAGIGDILVAKKGGRCVDTSKFTCDLYLFLDGNEKYKKMFHQLYMANYSWGENTLAILSTMCK